MSKRYGRDAYRIFRLLSKSGRLLETDKVIILTYGSVLNSCCEQCQAIINLHYSYYDFVDIGYHIR